MVFFFVRLNFQFTNSTSVSEKKNGFIKTIKDIDKKNEEEVSVRGKVMRCSFHCVFERVEAVIHHRLSTVNDNDIQKRMAIAFNVFNVGRIETLLI